MRSLNKALFSFLCGFFLCLHICQAEEAQKETLSLQGEVSANNTNIRSDSTVSSEVICTANQGDSVEIISELYDWYKIRLPDTAAVFVKKTLVAPIDDNTIKVIRDKVNIRLHPDESAVILGRVNKDEVLNVLDDSGDWYKIEPVKSSFGWINKKFVDKVSAKSKLKITELPEEEQQKYKASSREETVVVEDITVEGVIRPQGKILKQKATHKLVTEDNQIFLLKGNKGTLDALNYHKVKISGKLITVARQKYPRIDIEKIVEETK